MITTMDIDRILYNFYKTIPGRLMRMPLSQARRTGAYLRVVWGEKLGLPKPKTFTLKLEWLKHFDRNPLLPYCADKVKVRDYVRKKIGSEYLIPAIGSYKNAAEIPFESLPSKFVLKANNSSGRNIICTNKSSLDIDATRKSTDKWLTEKFGTIDSEWHYGLIEPAILVENFVADSNGELNDYKFFCMNGRLEYFWIDYDRYGPNPLRAIFDRDKRRINMTLYKPDYKGDIKMPAEIDHMMALAEKLSKDFKCVRVDLYNVDGRIYFGELTFFSGDLIFHPRKYNRVWGDKLDI